jgi:choice-of-anchor B domain-containing protein
MKRFIVFFLTAFLSATTLFAQGVTYNTTLYGARLYAGNRGSGCWGYSDTVMVGGQPRIRELAFFGCFRGVSIVDITSPTLRELALIPTQSTSPTDGGNSWREIRTSGKYAYITTEAAGGGLQIVDLLPDPNNPDSVRLVTKFTTGGTNNNQHNLGSNAGFAWESSNYLYLCGGGVTQGFGNSGGMAIYDVTNKTAPVLVSRYAPRYAHDVYVKNDTAYIANINSPSEGIDIVSVVDKANPVRLRTFTYPNAGTHNIWVTADSKYMITTDEIAPAGQNILRVHDVRNYNNIRVNVATYRNPVGPANAVVHNAYMRGNYAIMSYYTEGLKIVDLTEPEDPVEVGAFDAQGGSSGTWGCFPFYPSGKIIGSTIGTTGQSGTGKLVVVEFNNARAGIVYGRITSATTSQPIQGASITAIDFYNKARLSSAQGNYRIRTVQGNTKRFVISANGFRTDTVTVNVPTNNDSILVNYQMTSTMSAATENQTVARTFALEQNYPNPFNPSTEIRYQIAAASDVRLEVFDMLGRKVSTLVNERKPAGVYNATFNAANLSSGTYFYRLSAEGFVETRRMLLVK